VGIAKFGQGIAKFGQRALDFMYRDIPGTTRPEPGPKPRPEASGPRMLSRVGDRSGGGLACPKCGGNQFKAKRSRGVKVALAPVAILIAAAPKTRVKCVTCGEEYLRG